MSALYVMIGAEAGVIGFMHPERIYDDPKGGKFRAKVYPSLRGHYQFQNEMSLFSEVNHATIFSINVYGVNQDVEFEHLANLFALLTIDACYQHDNQGPVPGIKNDRGKWNASRIIRVDELALKTFAQPYDEPGIPPKQARLPAPTFSSAQPPNNPSAGKMPDNSQTPSNLGSPTCSRPAKCNLAIPGLALPGSTIPKKTSALWQPDYWDRFIRNEQHLLTAKHYIEQNPVQAGLVENAAEWAWGSARLGLDT